MASFNQLKQSLQKSSTPELKVNEKGGLYIRGKAYPVSKWEEIIDIHSVMKNESNGEGVSIREVANATNISWRYTKNVIDRYTKKGDVHPKSQYKNRPLEPGLLSGLTEEHERYMLYLRFEDPFRSNISYVWEMRRKYNVSISKQFVPRWFQDHFERRG